MPKCQKCEYCILETSGEEESFYGHSYVSDYSEELDCKRGHYKKFKLDGETDCKGI
ncbi:hypothetical protein [Clostridium botulinum]|uniref:hypothetical protein n=1 Tax=Clostridium botulinum TaxID=1491 RepID=UPI00058633FB|nr:hypothetical protein [Clostridium botulinum]AJE11089.1 hypothetical protein T259_1919 [Clostridium botulinum CDC_1436]